MQPLHHKADSYLLSPLILIRLNHWFDGMALLHQFRISEGQVTYKSRFLASDSYQANKEYNRIAVSEFGTVTMPDPCKNFFQRFLSRFELPSEYFIKWHGNLDTYTANKTNLTSLTQFIGLLSVYFHLLRGI